MGLYRTTKKLYNLGLYPHDPLLFVCGGKRKTNGAAETITGSTSLFSAGGRRDQRLHGSSFPPTQPTVKQTCLFYYQFYSIHLTGTRGTPQQAIGSVSALGKLVNEW